MTYLTTYRGRALVPGRSRGTPLDLRILNVSDTLRRLMSEQGINGVQLAERAGLSSGCIYSTLNAPGDARLVTLIRLARGLGCKVDDLLVWPEGMEP